MILTRAELENLKRLASEATPGPWQRRGDGIENKYISIAICEEPYRLEDAIFIQVCNPSVITALVSRLIEAEDALKAMKSYDRAIFACTENGQFKMLEDGSGITTGENLDELYEKSMAAAFAYCEKHEVSE